MKISIQHAVNYLLAGTVIALAGCGGSNSGGAAGGAAGGTDMG